ncbi:MAG TPA: glycosyltransferase family 9 protein [Gemmatimonadaceae bacterium]|jgi:heptosyltransferase I|nr:glycosyltransferase family 9 protein [Gemmatimonadaceae bacterium]
MSSYKLDRICIVMMSAIGDAVHVLPVINAIKRHHPSSHITWVMQSGPASLVRGHPAVDDIVIFDRTSGWRGFLRVREELHRHQFDLLIDLQVYLKAGVITALSGAPVRLGFDRSRARDMNWLFTNRQIPARPVQHVQDQYFEFLTELGISPEPVEWNLGPWPNELEVQHQWGERIGQRYAVIIVATSKPDKDWIPERWAEICDVLQDSYNLRPVLAGGNSEREKHAAEIILKNTRSDAFNALGSGLRQLVSIIDASQIVLSPDTGPLHMSVALNKPVISLIGYSDPRRTGPYREFQDLIIDAYHDSGEKTPVSMETRSGRMPRITVSDVRGKLRLWKERYRPKS